ncbi:MAG: arginine--tRNA ligase [Bacillota bacterium]
MSVVQAVKDNLKSAIKQAIANNDEINVEQVPQIKIEVPREEEHGDYATNIAMVLAGQVGMAPRQIAEIIAQDLKQDIIEEIVIAGPGFINFHLNNNYLYQVIENIHQTADEYGTSDLGLGKKVQVEFVSANPTGPLHVGHSRGAVVGDVLANILETAGYEVQREYYINDAGNQLEILGNSVAVRYQQLLGEDVELPEDSYQGAYIEEIAQEIIDESGEEYLADAKNGKLDYFREFAYQQMLDNIRTDLNEFEIEFDNWFSERTLHPDAIEEVIAELREKGFIYEQEGALWFKSTEFGDDKDRVVVKSDGSYTYFAPDIAYHKDKYERGFDHAVNVLGADHHGYVARMEAVVKALGYSEDWLDIILVQLVNLLRDGETVTMSKRAGEFVTLRDVVEEVGIDAARYFYVLRDTDSHLDFDLKLAKEESTDNPVYYIQYAHARICSIEDQLKESGYKIYELEDVDLSNLTADIEFELIEKLAQYPTEIATSAESKAPHHIARYAYELASLFHKFYNKCHVLGEDEELLKARTSLVEATKQVLLNVLAVLGISAPESM